MLCQSDSKPRNQVASTGRVTQTRPTGAANQELMKSSDHAVSTASQGPAQGPLETTAKSVGHFATGRADRYRWQRHAAKLLGGVARVGQCRHSVVSKTAGVDVVSGSYGDGKGDRAHYQGLQTCGSVWACPCCGARISEKRREELGRLLSWARAQGYVVRMVTLTCRHGRDDNLAELLTLMKGRSSNKKTGKKGFRGAKQRMVANGTFKRHVRPHVIGSVTATEVTGGGCNGWHPHMHMILILDREIDLAPMRQAWLGSLAGVGLEGSGQGWDDRDASEAGTYIAKWGAAEELALSGHKKGRSGRTPAQLLAASCDDGDRRAGHLWAEYAREFHGKRQLVWSPGLKELVGIDEVDDEEAAQDETQEEQIETGLANIPHQVWVGDVVGRRSDRRADVLDRAEEVGVEQAVSELIAGYDPDLLIEKTELEDTAEAGGHGTYRPTPGGLAASVVASVRPPLGQGP